MKRWPNNQRWLSYAAGGQGSDVSIVAVLFAKLRNLSELDSTLRAGFNANRKKTLGEAISTGVSLVHLVSDFI